MNAPFLYRSLTEAKNPVFNGVSTSDIIYGDSGRFNSNSEIWTYQYEQVFPMLYGEGYAIHEHLAPFGLVYLKELTGFFAEGSNIGTSGFYNNLSIDDDLGNVNSGNKTGGNTDKQTKSKRNTAEENLNDINDPFLLSRIIATIYYDAKHALSEFVLNSNSIMASSGLKWRVKYKTDENGNEIFGTQITIEPAGSPIEEGVHMLLNGLTLYSFCIGEGVNRLFSETGSNTQAVRIARESVSDSAEAAKTGGKELFNFGTTAAKHMAQKGRAVPVQILEQAIKGSKGVADPKGSRALMHNIEMFRNSKAYKLEVLYDKTTNSIWHFEYSPIKS